LGLEERKVLDEGASNFKGKEEYVEIHIFSEE